MYLSARIEATLGTKIANVNVIPSWISLLSSSKVDNVNVFEENKEKKLSRKSSAAWLTCISVQSPIEAGSSVLETAS